MEVRERFRFSLALFESIDNPIIIKNEIDIRKLEIDNPIFAQWSIGNPLATYIDIETIDIKIKKIPKKII